MNAEEDDWRMSFGVNVIGASNMVQAVVPFMKKGKSGIEPWTYTKV